MIAPRGNGDARATRLPARSRERTDGRARARRRRRLPHARGAVGEAASQPSVSPGGFGDSALLPPIANTCSCDARPPPEEVGVPPTVIAMYSLPPEVKIVGPAAI